MSSSLSRIPDDTSDIQNIYRIFRINRYSCQSRNLDEAKLFGPCVPGPGIAQMVELQETLAPYSPVKVA
jgi:hypothetical protein